MIFCLCGCPCFSVFWCGIVWRIVWLAFSSMEISECGTGAGKIFLWISSLKSGFSWRGAWVRVYHSIWLGTLAPAGHVCWRSLEEKLSAVEGRLAGS
jgi:hypothetical protein